jgi:hypothetical protein
MIHTWERDLCGIPSWVPDFRFLHGVIPYSDSQINNDFVILDYKLLARASRIGPIVLYFVFVKRKDTISQLRDFGSGIL